MLFNTNDLNKYTVLNESKKKLTLNSIKSNSLSTMNIFVDVIIGSLDDKKNQDKFKYLVDGYIAMTLDDCENYISLFNEFIEKTKQYLTIVPMYKECLEKIHNDIKSINNVYIYTNLDTNIDSAKRIRAFTPSFEEIIRKIEKICAKSNLAVRQEDLNKLKNKLYEKEQNLKDKNYSRDFNSKFNKGYTQILTLDELNNIAKRFESMDKYIDIIKLDYKKFCKENREFKSEYGSRNTSNVLNKLYYTDNHIGDRIHKSLAMMSTDIYYEYSIYLSSRILAIRDQLVQDLSIMNAVIKSVTGTEAIKSSKIDSISESYNEFDIDFDRNYVELCIETVLCEGAFSSVKTFIHNVVASAQKAWDNFKGSINDTVVKNLKEKYKEALSSGYEMDLVKQYVNKPIPVMNGNQFEVDKFVNAKLPVYTPQIMDGIESQEDFLSKKFTDYKIDLVKDKTIGNSLEEKLWYTPKPDQQIMINASTIKTYLDFLDSYNEKSNKISADIQAINTSSKNVDNIITASGEANESPTTTNAGQPSQSQDNPAQPNGESSIITNSVLSFIHEGDGWQKTTASNDGGSNRNKNVKEILAYYKACSFILSKKMFQLSKTRQFCIRLIKQYGELYNNSKKHAEDGTDASKIDVGEEQIK